MPTYNTGRKQYMPYTSSNLFATNTMGDAKFGALLGAAMSVFQNQGLIKMPSYTTIAQNMPTSTFAQGTALSGLWDTLHGAPKNTDITQAPGPVAPSQSTIDVGIKAPSAVSPNLPAEIQKWLPQIQNAASKYGVPSNWLAALMTIESHGNPNAVSPSGARGLMQVMPFNAGPYNLSDPQQNLYAAATKLQRDYGKWGSWDKAAAAYFGALSASGNITNAKDVTGFGGNAYVDKAKKLAGQYAGVVDSAVKVIANYAFPVKGYKGKVSAHGGVAPGGADIFASAGTPVINVAPGQVLESGFQSIGGNIVLVQGDDGRQYYYAHMAGTPMVSRGQHINAGQQLGQVGTTGNARGTPPHLHIGIGQTIQNGKGAYGGVGTNFNAASFLTQVESGNVGVQGAVEGTQNAMSDWWGKVTNIVPNITIGGYDMTLLGDNGQTYNYKGVTQPLVQIGQHVGKDTNLGRFIRQ